MIIKKIIYSFFALIIVMQNNLLSNEISEKGIITLMYHRFEENKYPSTNIKINDFKNHIELIKNSNIEFINEKTLKEIVLKKKNYTEKKILLTIDDAFLSFYKNAWPILQKEKIPFILFVNTREINNRHPNYMSWDQIREIHKSNIGVIGGHSFSHEYLAFATEDEIIKDINKSIEDYKRELNFNPEVFSYPFGEYSLEVKNIVKKLGYVIAFGQHSGVVHQRSDLFELPRFPINESYGTLDRFSFLLKTSPLPYKFFKPDEKLLKTNNPPSIEIEFEQNVKNINCFTNEGGSWKKSEITYLENNWIRVLLKEKYKPRRGKINCTLKMKDGSWGWLGKQFIVSD
jgi:peptidoglycan/xylan/chitin deacetylase (PgdA/CDA1 family)